MDNSAFLHRPRNTFATRALLGFLEAALWAFGLVLLIWFGVTLNARAEHSHNAMAQFEARQAQIQSEQLAQQATQGIAEHAAAQIPLLENQQKLSDALQTPDQNLWSARRVEAYEQATSAAPDTPLAVLRAPALNLATPVYADTDETSLNRGAGWISGTSELDQAGNIGIAAHRDSFFRALKDVKPGMTLVLDTLWQTRAYRVTKTQIVKPEDIRVLAPSEDNRLTLVTCYPFYFIGHAPKRFIVTAIEDEAVQPTL